MKKTAKSTAATALATALTTLLSLSSSFADSGSRSFVGTWPLNVRCGDNTMINTLRVSRADQSAVEGTTNVGDGFGIIVGGNFDGSEVNFVNKYEDAGKRWTENWKLKMSNDGKSVKGTFRSNRNDITCQYSGKRS